MIPIINTAFEKASTVFGSSSDELKLIFSLLLSYPLAGLLKRIPDASPHQKNLFAVGCAVLSLPLSVQL
jgi:lysophospholipid acyltransferase